MTMLMWAALGGGAVTATVLVAAMVGLKITVRSRDRVRLPDEKVYGRGSRRALLLYQPSNRGGNVNLSLGLAKVLGEEGYTVVVNYPSELLPYCPEDFDLLLFGTNVYLGETAKPLQSYLHSHPFTGQRVILYVTGQSAASPELAALEGQIAGDNEVYSIKIKPGDQEGLIRFVKAHLDPEPSA